LNHGGIDIRKNLDGLIEAFAEVHIKHSEINLVITGDNKRIRKELEGLIKKLNLGTSVIFTGYVNDLVLNSIIKNALMICYPTLSEGFGFPVLEGFGAGIPVISSNTSSIPEVAGNAGLLINPESVNAISEAIEKVLMNKEIRKTMVLKGKQQYNRFNWQKTGHDSLALYNSIK
jgi:glycosyltransferase involved in cell wall biosynthesis